MKFKVGDEVIVVKSFDTFIGSIGIISKVYPDFYELDLTFDPTPNLRTERNPWNFNESEIRKFTKLEKALK